MKKPRIGKNLVQLLLCSVVVGCALCSWGCGGRLPSMQVLRPHSYVVTTGMPSGWEINKAVSYFHIETPATIATVDQFLVKVYSWIGGDNPYTVQVYCEGQVPYGDFTRTKFKVVFEDSWYGRCEWHGLRHGLTTWEDWVLVGDLGSSVRCDNPPLRTGNLSPIDDTMIVAVPEVVPIEKHPVYGRVLRFYNVSHNVRAGIIEARAAISPIELPQESLFVGNTALEALAFHNIISSYTVVERDDSVTVDVDETTPVTYSDFVYLVMVCDNPDDTVGTSEAVFKVGPMRQAIPTLTEWGMIIFFVLLAGWMALVVVRRWKASHVRT